MRLVRLQWCNLASGLPELSSLHMSCRGGQHWFFISALLVLWYSQRSHARRLVLQLPRGHILQHISKWWQRNALLLLLQRRRVAAEFDIPLAHALLAVPREHLLVLPGLRTVPSRKHVPTGVDGADILRVSRGLVCQG